MKHSSNLPGDLDVSGFRNAGKSTGMSPGGSKSAASISEVERGYKRHGEGKMSDTGKSLAFISIFED